MAPQSKAQFLNEVHTLLKKRYKPKPEKAGARLTVLEAVIYGICHEGTTREQANQALSRFKDGFFDWNEVRVSTIEEIQSVLTDFSESEARATRIRRFLRQLFEKTYGFTLEALTKKPLKESLKSLAEYESFQSDYVEAAVTRLALGGHAIPVDRPVQRVMERLGIAHTGEQPSALRGLLERSIPKNRASEFLDVVEELAHDTCIDPEPDCPRCELRKICPTASARKEEASNAAKQAAANAKQAVKDKAKAEKEKAAAIEKAAKEKEVTREKGAPKAKAKETPKVVAKGKEAPKAAAAPKAPAKPSPRAESKAAPKVESKPNPKAEIKTARPAETKGGKVSGKPAPKASKGRGAK